MQWKKRSYRMYKKIWKRGQCPCCRRDVNSVDNTITESFYENGSCVEAYTRCGKCGCLLGEMSYGPWGTWWDMITYEREWYKKCKSDPTLAIMYNGDCPF